MDNTRESMQAEITALKMLLAETDYNSNKLIESLVVTMSEASAVNFIAKFVAWLSGAIKDFGEVVRNRAAWRDRINELEKLLEDLADDLADNGGSEVAN